MSIVTKIKALLAKAKSTDNEHEAIAFMQKAEELLEAHQLGLSDLDTEDPISAHFRRASSNGSGDWADFLYSACAAYYGCRLVVHTLDYKGLKRESEVFGRLSAVVTLNEMHSYMVATVRRLGRQHADEWSLKPDQAARRIGNALVTRLRGLAQANSINTTTRNNALLVVDPIQALIDATYKNLTSTKSGKRYTSVAARGVAAGIGLSSQVAGRGALQIGMR
jgi:hypothetical protein